jgi:hypothetical protein
MSKTRISVCVTTLVVLVYVTASTLSTNFAIVFLLLLLAQGLLIWMVITILKDKPAHDRTFDEYFYGDADIRPNK